MNGFYAYPAKNAEIVFTIQKALELLEKKLPSFSLSTWETNDIAGRCLVDPILSKIQGADILVADISYLNFNVIYEIGYAIGRGKRPYLVRSVTHSDPKSVIDSIGFFDTIGYKLYNNSENLSDLLAGASDTASWTGLIQPINRKYPVYFALPRQKAESEVHIRSRITVAARINCRFHDPEENGRLTVRKIIDEVASSVGVVVSLISENRTEAFEHNMRCAFIAGLAYALEKEILFLQAGNNPVPLDYRDYVNIYARPDEADKWIAKYATAIMGGLQAADIPPFTPNENPLANLKLGASSAENEILDLRDYYLKTQAFQRVTRGEVQLVVGRRGSGKTALYLQAKDTLLRDKRKVVADLNPEGYQLKKFKELVLTLIEDGSREHLLTAFWEYVLLVEIANAILLGEKSRHMHDPETTILYHQLKALAYSDSLEESDFAERLMNLTEQIEARASSMKLLDGGVLKRDEVSNIIYSVDVKSLRTLIEKYSKTRDSVWVLFDNLDKGWSTNGVDAIDISSLRCLLDAVYKLRRDFRKGGATFHGVLFIRNDVFERLVEGSVDRGKFVQELLDWEDPEMLRELLRLRLVQANKDKIAFDEIWGRYFETHMSNGEETSQYFINRSLRRPRALIEFIERSKGHALNLNKKKVEESDILIGEQGYSIELIRAINLEIRDVYNCGDNLLFALIECDSMLSHSALAKLLDSKLADLTEVEEVIKLLLWFGVIGIYRKSGEVTYIFDVGYSMPKLEAILGERKEEDKLYEVNAAFWKALDIK